MGLQESDVSDGCLSPLSSRVTFGRKTPATQASDFSTVFRFPGSGLQFPLFPLWSGPERRTMTGLFQDAGAPLPNVLLTGLVKGLSLDALSMRKQL